MKKSRRQPINLVNNSRWAAYATAGAATALAGVNSAEADIHHVVVNQGFAAASGAAVSNSFALDNNAVIKFAQFRGPYGSITNTASGAAFFRIQGAAVSNQFRGQAPNQYRYVSNLASGVPVSGGAFINHNGVAFATLAYGAGVGNSQWKTAGTGFIGFRFNGGTGIEYGWARLTVSGTTANTFTVVDYAWGDAGTPIATGQTAVPEPGSLGLLALGASGLLAWRRSRAQAASQD